MKSLQTITKKLLDYLTRLRLKQIIAFAILLYSAINVTHNEHYTWDLFYADTISFASNPHRLIIFLTGLKLGVDKN